MCIHSTAISTHHDIFMLPNDAILQMKIINEYRRLNSFVVISNYNAMYTYLGLNYEHSSQVNGIILILKASFLPTYLPSLRELVMCFTNTLHYMHSISAIC